MPWEYSEKVFQLFKEAVRGSDGTHMGEIENLDGFGEHDSIVYGDALRCVSPFASNGIRPTPAATLSLRPAI